MSARADTDRQRKICASCGREMMARRRWARHFDEVRYCSRACRARRVNAQDEQLEAAILSLLETRRADASICPSEAARAVAIDDAWRVLMEPARRAARRLAHRGAIDITQRGRVVDPSRFRGPIRLRLHPAPRASR